MTQITLSELSESLHQVFRDIEQSNNPLTVTYEGKPLVIITSATSPKPRPAAGAMKGQGAILGDIMTPLEEPWEVLR
jgi:hypothetical protein